MQLIGERRGMIVRLGAILAVLLMLGLVAPKQAEATTSPERAMASLINRARSANGRAALRLSDYLSNYARRHSATMASKNVLYHNPYLATWLNRLPWRILGENVGYGATVSAVYTAFMHSPSHKANILDRRYRTMGVGIVTSRGRTWVTVIFYA